MDKIIEYWNSSRTGSPKHKSKSTKIYKQTKVNLNKLKQGIFYQQNELDLTRYKDYSNDKINRILNKKWNEEELKYLLNVLSKLYQGGSWPLDKSKLPKSLNGLLYNPITKYSWLVTALLRQTTKNIPITETDPIKQIILEIIWEITPIKDNAKFIQILSKIDKKYEFLAKNRVFLSKYPTKTMWIKEYISYLKKQQWIDNITMSFFDTERKTFQDFIDAY